MKAAAFSLQIPADLTTAAQAAQAGARLLAGGQSLGPMLNLRLAQPQNIAAIAKLPQLHGATETETEIIIGAATTHAQIEDGLIPDIGSQILPGIAANIAYRAIRNRGTIGGSLCHADPRADWPTCLLALSAQAITFAPEGGRTIALDSFITGAFRTALADGEILRAIKIPKLQLGETFAYYKSCRKPGEFAHAMTALLIGPTTRRIVIGALGGPPKLFENDQANPSSIATALGHIPAIPRQMHLTTLSRALEKLAP